MADDTSNPSPLPDPLLSTSLLDLSESLTSLAEEARQSAYRATGVESDLSTAQSRSATLETELATANTLAATLKAELDKCKAEAAIPDPVPVPAPAPIPTEAPNIEIGFASEGEIIRYRPTSPGTRRKSALCWYQRITSTIGLWIYARDTEIRVCIGQCFATLLDKGADGKRVNPQIVPARKGHLTVDIDGTRVYDRGITLHPHGWHTYRFRPLPFPAVDLDKVSAAGLAPHYIPSLTTPTARDLQLMAERRWPWAHFAPVDAAGVLLERDPISEEYGLNATSWTGGLPSMDGTEGSTLSKSDLFAARSGAKVTGDNVLITADSMGNYGVHYLNPVTGLPLWPEDTGDLEQPDGKALLVADNILPRLRLGGDPLGKALPLPDTAHMPSLTYFAALVTGDPYYEDLQHSWAMLGVLCKTRNDGRLWGALGSGQVRAWAWGIRCVLHLYLLSEGERKERARAWLIRLLKSFIAENATPGGKFYRADHLFGTIKPRSAAGENEMYDFIRDPAQTITTTWWLAAFSHILHQCYRAPGGGFEEAKPALVYSLGVQEGWWRAVQSRSRFLCPWANIAVSPTQRWEDHVRLTFELMPASHPALTSFTRPVDMFYLGTYRSACIAAADIGQSWGSDALKFIDANIPAGKTLPPTWAFKAP